MRYFATKVGLKTVKKCLLLKSKMLFFFLRCYKPKRDLKKLVQKIILSIASVLKSRRHVITLLQNLFAWLGYHLFYCYCFWNAIRLFEMEVAEETFFYLKGNTKFVAGLHLRTTSKWSAKTFQRPFLCSGNTLKLQ